MKLMRLCLLGDELGNTKGSGLRLDLFQILSETGFELWPAKLIDFPDPTTAWKKLKGDLPR
jgi:hypothetical protein